MADDKHDNVIAFPKAKRARDPILAERLREILRPEANGR